MHRTQHIDDTSLNVLAITLALYYFLAMFIDPRDIKIGTIYKDRDGKSCRVVDIWRTYNANADLIKTRYVVEKDYMGQKVTDYDVVAVTIQRRIAEQS